MGDFTLGVVFRATYGSEADDREFEADDGFLMDNEKAEDCEGPIGTYKPEGNEEEAKEKGNRNASRSM